MRIEALLDSNVPVAALVEEHVHHAPSLGVLSAKNNEWQFAIAAHSYAEAYSTLTRRGDRARFQLTPDEAWMALESVRAVTALVGLTAQQTVEAIRAYALGAGIGARLYDRLIGETAAVHRIPELVTWNVGHMRGLFPHLSVVTPDEFLNRAL